MSTPRTYFDDLYRNDDDPWRYRTSWYERRKREILLASLPRERYACGFEPACSNGELSARLALRCDRLFICDASASAVRTARERVADARNVTVQTRSVPEDWPAQRFDLIVVSELAYYLAPETTATLAERAWASLADDGTFVACHWRPPFEGKLQSADDVHARFDTLFRGHGARLVQHAEPDFYLDVWSKDARSVGEREGLA